MKRLACAAAVAAFSILSHADWITCQGFCYVGSSAVTYVYIYNSEYAVLKSISGLKTKETLPISPTINDKPLKRIGDSACSACVNIAAVEIPPAVEYIGQEAFYCCTGLTNLQLSVALKYLGKYAFSYCAGLTNIDLPKSLGFIDNGVFAFCENLTEIEIPASVTNVGNNAFNGCSRLTNVVFLGEMPFFGANVFSLLPSGATIDIRNPKGWDYYEKKGITPPWEGMNVIMPEAEEDEPVAVGTTVTNVVMHCVTITNVVIHYVSPCEASHMAAPVSDDVGFVNVITEIKGGGVAVPTSWTNNYPTFAERFGADFTAALTMPTGKTGPGGAALMVWHDFVAGTDPTDENSIFKASVTLVGGKPVVSYTPELTAAEKARRRYVTWGKVKLQDEVWSVVDTGEEEKYNFFKVSVEMR